MDQSMMFGTCHNCGARCLLQEMVPKRTEVTVEGTPTVDGLVIREKMLSNDNRLVTILTGEYGLVRTFVRSVKKLGGTMAAATDLFSYSSFTLFYNKDQYSADGAEPLLLMLAASDGQAFIQRAAGEAAPLYLKLGVDRLLPKLQFVYDL